MVIPYPRIPPTIVSIGPIAIRWYSLMYVIGYVVGYRLVLKGVADGRAMTDRQLHQRRAVWQTDQRSVGNGVPHRSVTAATAPFAAL